MDLVAIVNCRTRLSIRSISPSVGVNLVVIVVFSIVVSIVIVIVVVSHENVFYDGSSIGKKRDSFYEAPRRKSARTVAPPIRPVCRPKIKRFVEGKPKHRTYNKVRYDSNYRYLGFGMHGWCFCQLPPSTRLRHKDTMVEFFSMYR